MSEQKTNIDCPNYLICKKSGNRELYDCYNQKCLSCDVLLGEWKGGDGVLKYLNSDCCICLEENVKSVKMPTCNHSVCVKDFTKLYNDANPFGEGEECVIELKCPLCRAK